MVSVSYSGYDGQLSVYCMAIVDGQLWVGTDGQGVKIYNPLKDQLEDYRINSASVDFSKGKVHSIMEDRGWQFVDWPVSERYCSGSKARKSIRVLW